MKYKIKKLIDGKYVNEKFKDKILVAVPEERLRNGYCIVEYGDEKIYVEKKDKLYELEFDDKFGREKKYKLLYFEWKKKEEQLKLNF